MQKTIFLPLFLLFIVLAWPVRAAEIVFSFPELRNEDGQILCTLHNIEDAFPRDSNRAFRAKMAPIKNGTAKCVFKDIPAGSYAATLAHDENDNRKVDLGAFGLPLEGFAFSNNAKPDFFGPPSFNESLIALEESRITQEIKFIYPDQGFVK